MSKPVVERPIIFSGEMVRAILEGRKTQARRAMKPQPTPYHDSTLMWKGDVIWQSGRLLDGVASPYGKPGDQLWVRETFITGYNLDHNDLPVGKERTWYREDRDLHDWLDDDGYMTNPKWRPSIHMPRWSSRITLEVTGVRVERLQDISKEDAIAEGVEGWNLPTGDDYQDYWRDYSLSVEESACSPHFTGDPQTSFRSLWQSIHGHDSWQVNPWVWVIEFARIQQNDGGGESP